MMKVMIPPQVGMRRQTLQKKEAKKRERPKKKKGEKEKKSEKKREGTMLLSLFRHLCFKIASWSS